MGATTIASRKQGVRDNKKVVQAEVTFSSSYATGGDTVAVSSLGLKEVHSIKQPSHDLITQKAVSADNGPNRGFTVRLAGTAKAPKLQLYSDAAVEVANAVNTSGLTYTVQFEGI